MCLNKSLIQVYVKTQNIFSSLFVFLINNFYTHFPGVKSQWEGYDDISTETDPKQTQLKQSIKNAIEDTLRATFNYDDAVALLQKADASRRATHDHFQQLTPEESQQLVNMWETVYIALRELGFTHDELQKYSK